MKKLFYLIAIVAVAGFALSSCTNELEAVKIDGKWGFANTAKKVVVPCQYDDVRGFSEGFATVKLDGKWGVINTKGDVVVSCEYDDAYCFSNGFARVKENGKYGFINTQGVLVISCQYDDADDFFEGKAIVKKGDIWEYIDKNGADAFRGPEYETALQRIKGKRAAENVRREEEKRIAENVRREEEQRRAEEESKRREEERKQKEWDIMIKIHNLQEQYQQRYHIVERLYRQKQNTNILLNPDIQFELNKECNKMIDIISEQIRLSEELGDADMVREYRERRKKAREAADIMLYGTR